jgi:hypothetical protein
LNAGRQVIMGTADSVDQDDDDGRGQPNLVLDQESNQTGDVIAMGRAVADTRKAPPSTCPGSSAKKHLPTECKDRHSDPAGLDTHKLGHLARVRSSAVGASWPF